MILQMLFHCAAQVDTKDFHHLAAKAEIWRAKRWAERPSE